MKKESEGWKILIKNSIKNIDELSFEINKLL